MIALDTNVIVRLATEDDAAQFARAKALVAGNECYISATVLLEAEWVLRSAYGKSRLAISSYFRALFTVETITVEGGKRMFEVLENVDAGLDFADALHLAHAGFAQSFATFDEALVRRSKMMKTLVTVRFV